MADLDISHTGLRASGGRISAAATQFATDLAAFQAKVAAYGEPWGDDDLGMLIGVAYQALSEYAFDCYDVAREELDSMGVDLGKMADSHEAADAQAARHLTDLHQKLDA